MADPGLREAITAANRDFMATFASGDAAGMARLYTTDGQLLPANSDFVSGSEAIQAFWQGVMDSGLKSAKLETLELDGYEDTAIEVGKYELGGSDGHTVDSGKYVVIWKNDDGRWKLHRDIWNTSQSI